MAATFSINIGQSTQTSSYDLTNDLNSVLTSLQDNIDKEVVIYNNNGTVYDPQA